MKVYPRIEQNEKKRRLSNLTTGAKIQRYLAILLAFVSVYIFFVKLLFF